MVGNMKKSDLVDIAVDTTLGDHYEFPSIRRSDVEVLTKGKYGPTATEDNLAMLNASRAWMAIPWRIVNAISIRSHESIDAPWEFIWTQKSQVGQERH